VSIDRPSEDGVRILEFTGRRMLVALPQLIAVTFLTFLLIRLLPGDPAQQLAGQYGTPDVIQGIRSRLGLDEPITTQYGLYLRNLIHGDFGTSWFNSNAVADDLTQRLPATLELITITLFFILVLGVGLGILAAARPRGAAARTTRVYGALSGSFPDFWLGLVLAFILYFTFRIAPAPIGRLSIETEPPRHITGMYTVDSLVTGNWHAFGDAWAHLALPVATLTLAYMGAVVKLTYSTVSDALQSDASYYARACGLSRRNVMYYALRASLPEIVTLIAIVYTFLLAGAVLVENVYSWGGLGSYIVEAVNNSDYFPIQAFVLVAAVFNLIVFLVVDVLQILTDPRIEA
jgi:ABC-type dipeptide/oligopeptide/nickel transport system permease component